MNPASSLLIIDNYDSFTYTINYYFESLGLKTKVIQNDDPRLKNLEALKPSHIVLSPGPGTPNEAGYSLEIIKRYHRIYPMLGICLGHQCLAQAFGAEIIHADRIMHGKLSILSHTEEGLFVGIEQDFKVMRYHSLVIKPESLSTNFSSTAWTYDHPEKKVIMAIQDKNYPLFGVQFHPEAALSEHGLAIMQNFINLAS
jgi:anthranilate synthase/aminodeoxychorismate synthase-like glutamine amidotransferase